MSAPALPGAELVGEGMSREEWLEARKLGLGGSDIAAALGVSPFKSPLALYLEKSGEIDDDFKETDATKWGNYLEQPIADAFTSETGIVTRQPPEITMYRSKELPIALASPDRLVFNVVEGGGAWHVNLVPDAWYEGKNVGAHRKDEWLDDEDKVIVPVHYLAQVQWENAVSGLPGTHIACLLGGQRFVHTYVERDEELIADMFAAADAFWKRLADHNAPAADGSASTTAVLKRRFAQSEPESVVDLGPELMNLVFEWRQATAATKAAKSVESTVENQIKALLRENEVGKNGELELVTFKTAPRKRYVVKDTTVRTLRAGRDAK